MQKNIASQKWVVFAFDETNNTAKTGDAANITAEISTDGGAGGGNITDTNPTELEDGYYVFDITQGESNGDYLLILPESITANIQVIGVPGALWTTAPAINTLAISNARVNVDVTAISADTTAADNLELQYDGTGIIGDTYPFTQAGGAALGGGIAIFTTMTSVTVIQGSEQNLANASTSDTTRWTGDDDGTGAEFIFRCTPVSTSSIPVKMTFEGYYDEPAGSSNGATLQAYNFNTAVWDTIITLTNSNKNEKHQVPLSHAHKAPGGDTLETVAYTIGDVLLKFKQDTTETGNAVLLIDYMVVGFVNGLVTAADIQAELEENGASLLDTIRDELANATDGLGALKTLIDAVPTTTEIWDKAMVDMAAGAPSATATVLLAINWIYEICRNKVVTDKTNNEIIVYKDNSTTKLAESDISDDGTLFTRGKFGVAD